MTSRAVFILLFFSSLAAFAEDDDVRPVFGAHPGYLFNVSEEKNKRDIEMVMLERPKENRKALSEVIFDEKLSKEFQQQYKYRFGETAAEQVINSPGRNDEYTYFNSQSVTVQDYHKYQRQFGEYMGRRLVEYHFDNWARNDPQIRPVYLLKDRISNLDVTVKKGYKLKWKYSFSGPYMETTLENPYDIETKVQMQMNGIISSPAEVIYSVGYPVTKKVTVSALHRQYDGIYQLVISRKLNTHLSTSVTGSIDTLPAGPAIQQNLVLVGVGWTE